MPEKENEKGKTSGGYHFELEPLLVGFGEFAILIILLLLGFIVVFYIAVAIQLVVFVLLKKVGKIEFSGKWRNAIRVLIFLGLLSLITWFIWKKPDYIVTFFQSLFWQ